MENFNGEIWKPVVGYEDYYECSNLGRVRSVDRYVKGKTHQDKQLKVGKIKDPIKDSKGYLRVYLWKENKRKLYRIHHLVAYAFPEICGEWFEGAEIDHINTVITDNRAINIKWVTHTQNMNNPLTIENRKRLSL